MVACSKPTESEGLRLPIGVRLAFSFDDFICPKASHRILELTLRKAFRQRTFGFGIDKCDAAIHAGRIRVPVLVFQAGDDTVAPPEGARRIYDNIKTPKRLVAVDHAKHVMCYEKAPAVFEREVRNFIEQCVVRLVSKGQM